MWEEQYVPLQLKGGLNVQRPSWCVNIKHYRFVHHPSLPLICSLPVPVAKPREGKELESPTNRNFYTFREWSNTNIFFEHTRSRTLPRFEKIDDWLNLWMRWSSHVNQNYSRIFRKSPEQRVLFTFSLKQMIWRGCALIREFNQVPYLSRLFDIVPSRWSTFSNWVCSENVRSTWRF